MTITLLTLFPEILEAYFGSSIMARAVKKGLVSYKLVNIRDYAPDKHRTCDDVPFGGGPGMVFKPEPLANALDAIPSEGKRTIYLTPSGALFDQKMAHTLAKEDDLIVICGRYEGIDQRIIDRYVTDEISIGDYVLSSGEVAALVLVDAVYRLIDGVIKDESLAEESFVGGLLEYPHYTRPADFRGMAVPEVLISGHHAKITEWRLDRSIEKTLRYRPQLLEAEGLSSATRKRIERMRRTTPPKDE